MPHYSEDQRSEALALLVANDGNKAKTQRQLKQRWDQAPSWQTIANWEKKEANPETSSDEAIQENLGEKKQDLADRLEDIAWMFVDAIEDEEKMKSSSMTQLTTGFGTVVDKMRLLREEATEINEQRSGDDYGRKLKERFESLRSGEDVPERN